MMTTHSIQVCAYDECVRIDLNIFQHITVCCKTIQSLIFLFNIYSYIFAIACLNKFTLLLTMYMKICLRK